MTPTTTTPPTLPPPAPGTAYRPPAPAEQPPRRPWRDRIPELVGGIGTVLVVAAVAGFVSDTWETLDQLGRAIVLGAAAAGLTVSAAMIEGRMSRRLGPITSMLWVAGSATTGASVLLAASIPLEGMARITALVAGLAISAHAMLAVRRSPTSPLRQVGVVAGLIVAAGPFGTSVADRASWETLTDLFTPLIGLLDPTVTDDAFLITGLAHLVIGAGWLLWSRHTDGAARHTATVGATALLGFTALELYVLPWGIGAFGALLIVLATLVYGLVSERTGVVIAGTIGVLIAGGRVIWSLFSGEVAVTIAAFTVGLALLTWAVRARSGDDDSTTVAAPATAPGAGARH